MKEMKKIQGMRCKIFTKIMILLMVCLLASCAEDPYLKTSSTEQEESSNEKNAAADEEASAGEGVSENEGVTKILTIE